MIKHYRFRKVTPEILKEMKKLRTKNLTYKKIAEKFRLNDSTVQYWLSSGYKEKAIKRAMKHYSKLTKEELRKQNRKNCKRRQEYIKERYNNDEVFRKQYIKYVCRSFKKRQNEWVKNGLCNKCGNERKDKQYFACERCRKKLRKPAKR